MYVKNTSITDSCPFQIYNFILLQNKETNKTTLSPGESLQHCPGLQSLF